MVRALFFKKKKKKIDVFPWQPINLMGRNQKEPMVKDGVKETDLSAMKSQK